MLVFIANLHNLSYFLNFILTLHLTYSRIYASITVEVNAMKEQLQLLRKNRGLTQEDISDILGVKLSTYQKYERDAISPSYDTLNKIADFYDVTTDYLLGREKKEQTAIEQLAGEFDMSALEREILNGYVNLPKEMRGDLMEFLHKAVMNVMTNNSQTVTCGELEDRQKIEADAKDNAG